MIKKLCLLGALMPLALTASNLEEKPWFGTVYEFLWKTELNYSRYRHIQGANPQLTSASNDKVLTSGLYFAPTGTLDAEFELEFAATPRQKFSYRSVALQTRYLFWDDVLGDPFSVAAGINIRAVSSRGLRDVSCPYHANGNIELTGSIGKEWDQGPYWFLRTFLFTTAGMGNRGFPWNHTKLSIEGNYVDRHRFELMSEGYFGFGHEKTINPDDFYGYAKVHHESIDVGAAYRVVLAYWGMFSFEYKYRVYAKAFPEHANFFIIRYQMPFSIF